MRHRMIAVALLSAGAVWLGGCGDSHDRPRSDGGVIIVRDGAPTGDAGPGTDGAVRPDGATADGGPSSGESRFFVLSVLEVGEADPAGDPNIVPGFDVDMHNTTSMSDPIGCGFIDFTSPPPDDIPGVDNQLGPILAGVAGTVDIPGAIRSNIMTGALIVLVEVTGIDSFTSDDSVQVNIYRGVLRPGVTAPMLGASGLLAPGQTFDIDARTVRADGAPATSTPGRIVGGRLRAGPTGISLDLDVMAMPFRLDIGNAQLRFNVAPTSGIDTGVLGGALQVTDVVTTVAMYAPDLEMTIRTILSGQADLEADATGVCKAISIGLTFEGVSAVKGSVVTVP